MYFDQKIYFLQYDDFELDGKLKHDLKGRYILIMVGGSYCPHCTMTVPELDAFTKNALEQKLNIISGFVQVDGDDTEKQLGRFFGKMYEIKGIPVFLLYGPDGKIVKVNYEDRSRDELMNFVLANIS